MNICYLTPEFPHPKTGSSGGLGTSIKNLTNTLANMGHSVIIVVYGQSEDELFEFGKLKILRLKNVRFYKISWFLTQKKVQKHINLLIDKYSIDILEVPDWTGFSAFISVKVPVVMRLNGSDTYFCNLDNRPVKPFNYLMEKRAFKKADFILSVSKYTGDLTNKLFKMNRQISVLPNGVDIEYFNSSEPKNYSKPLILYFGTLIRKKGVLEIPTIFNIVHSARPDAELILIGNDSFDIFSGSHSTFDLMKIGFSAKALSRVTYLGGMPYDEVKAHIYGATVCMFPSFAEAMPVSWIEAMALQTPVVCSNIGWAFELVDHGVDGFLVDPKDHSSFAEHLLKILNDQNLAEQIGKNSRKKIIRKFSSEYVANLSLKFYKNIIAN